MKFNLVKIIYLLGIYFLYANPVNAQGTSALPMDNLAESATVYSYVEFSNPGNAIDGDENTYAEVAYTNNDAIITIELDGSYLIDQIKVNASNDAMPITCTIAVSETAAGPYTAVGSSQSPDIEISEISANAQYVRLTYNMYDEDELHVFEVEIYEYTEIISGDDIVLDQPLTTKTSAMATNSVTLEPGFNTNGFNFGATISSILSNPITVASYTAPSSYPSNYNDELNYIRTIVPKDAISTIPASHNPVTLSENIQYFDGLGRPIQSIAIKASPTGKDIVQHIEYDSYGRQDRDYLPYTATSGNGAFVDPTEGIVTAIDNFYPNVAGAIADDGGFPYAERTYDNSPLNRVLEQSAPGSPWQIDKIDGVSTFNGNTVRTTYTTNIASEVREFAVDASTNNCVGGASSYYAEGMLYVTEVKDENHNSTREYTDKQGQTVLKIADYGGLNLKTYYVYDDFGLLRYVLPPKLVASMEGVAFDHDLDDGIIKTGGYYYEYDARKRMTIKQVPGAGKVLMVYDNRDRLVATQDANMRKGTETDYSDDNWLITKYDVLNRPVMTCLLTSTGKTQGQMQTEANGFTNDNSNMGESIAASSIATAPYYGYSYNNSFPNFTSYSVEVQTITYYDTYDFDNNGTEDFGAVYAYIQDEASFLENLPKLENVKGLIVATRSKILNAQDAPSAINEMLLAVNYYDDKGRVVQTVADNHAFGMDYASTDYRYNGEVKQTVYTHISDFDSDGLTDDTDEDITLTETYTYDHAGRLLEKELGVNDRNKNINTSQVLAANRYNELGELVEKYSSINGTSTKVASQKTDYRYNIRGWLTKINEPDLSGTDGDVFGMELGYNTYHATLNTSGDAQFNGNISHVTWKNYNDATTKAYGFEYDNINRLLAADYGEEASSWSNSAFDVLGEDVTGNPTNIQYDANGNILSLRRNAVSGSALHNFVKYEYNGNQLTRIWEDGTDPGSDQYEYDANGNMNKDTRKGIENINYNHLNLPETVDFDADGNNSIGYVYDAAGNKHMKLLTENGADISHTNYLGSFVYIDNNLNYILTSEGRLKRTSGDYIYEYHAKDHLGNTRVVFNGYNDGGIARMQANDYYPFGLRHEPVNPEYDNKFLYNGKEWQDDLVDENSLDWYDYVARMYDPVIGRWHCKDPLEQFSSPYVYAANNPILFIDPSGAYSYPVYINGEYSHTVSGGDDDDDDEKDSDNTNNEFDIPQGVTGTAVIPSSDGNTYYFNNKGVLHMIKRSDGSTLFTPNGVIPGGGSERSEAANGGGDGRVSQARGSSVDGVLALGPIGIAFEIGSFSHNGKMYQFFSVGHAMGLEASLGINVLNIKDKQGNFNASDYAGYSVTDNGSIFIYTYGRESAFVNDVEPYRTGYKANNNGVGVSALPVGYSHITGWTWIWEVDERIIFAIPGNKL